MIGFDVEFEKDSLKRSKIVNDVLRALPEWFGLEDSIVEYCEESEKLPMAVLTLDEKPIGFCSLKVNYGINCDLYVLGILPGYHRTGLGQKMVAFIERYCCDNEIPYMSVKTLSERHPDEFYARTRKFYEKCGFVAFEEFPELWGKENPCLLMIKRVEQ